jgi:DNA adenine methylase
LLFDEHVEEIVLNDLNPGIAAFWRAVFDSPEHLIDLISGCRPTVEEWHAQRAIYAAAPKDDVALGFATFFLNRVNRSGILDARPIGGLDQRGTWKIDARWHAERLVARIKLLTRYGARVTISQNDGLEVVREAVQSSDAFIYADPPYVAEGDDLYMDTLRWDNHEQLARTLRGAGRWFLTYDADPRILDLYGGLRCASFGIAHTAAKQHIGREIAVFSDGLEVPSLALLGREPTDAQYVGEQERAAAQK